MIDKQTGVQCLEAENFLFARRNQTRRGTTSWTTHRMDIDIVGKLATSMIAQVKFYCISQTHPYHGPRYGPIKTPELVLLSIGQGSDKFFGLKLDHHRFRHNTADKRRDMGSGGDLRLQRIHRTTTENKKQQPH